MDTKDNRRYRRIPYNRLVHVCVPDEEEVSSIGLNYSMSGIGLLTKMTVDVGEIVNVRFKLGTGDDVRELKMRGVVVHSCQKGEHYETGLRFY